MKKLLVVKYGSSSVASRDSRQGIDQAQVDSYVRQLVELQQQFGLIVVSSGSAAVGRSRWLNNRGSDIALGQPFAMLGSAEAALAWQQAFSWYGILAGQLLVTHREIDDQREGWSLRQVLAQNLQHDIVTIVNENDALSDIELAQLAYGGDNDGLACHIALTIQADRLLLLTGVEGLLDNGRLVQQITARQQAYARKLAGEAGARGRGGMKTKVEAAIRASQQGITSYIAHATVDLNKVLNGQGGTRFIAKKIRKG